MVIPVVVLATLHSFPLPDNPRASHEVSTDLRAIVEAAMSSRASPVRVVLGENPNEVRRQLVGLSVEKIYNPHWEEGMVSSVHAGLKGLKKQVDLLSGVLLIQANGTAVSPKHLNRLIDAFKYMRADVVETFTEKGGSLPVLFHRDMLEKILELPADRPFSLVELGNDQKKISLPVQLDEGAEKFPFKDLGQYLRNMWRLAI